MSERLNLLNAHHIIEFARLADEFSRATYDHAKPARALVEAWRALDFMGIMDSAGLDERAEHGVEATTVLLQGETDLVQRMYLESAQEKYLVRYAASILSVPRIPVTMPDPISVQPPAQSGVSEPLIVTFGFEDGEAAE